MESRPGAFLSRLVSRRRVQRAHEHFDPGSGQVFSETTCQMTSMAPSWVTATTGSVADLINFRDVESVGAACLEQVALRSVLLQLDSLDCETLACVPWTIGKRVWACVRHLRLDSLRTWRLFVRAYPEERDAFQETRKVPLLTPKAQCKFDDIVKHITAPSFEWIAHLTLQDRGFSKSDWAKVAQIRNLGALSVLGPSDYLDDRVIRGWGEAAKEDHAFPRLRVIFLICEPWITTRSLRYLSMLPGLKLCNLTGCDVDFNQAGPYGWRTCQDEPLSHELNIVWTFSGNVYDPMRAYYRRAASPTLSLPEKIEPDEEPVLSLFKRATTLPVPSTCATLWLWRPDPAAHEDVKTEGVSTAKEPPRKKRKLRATKEKDISDVMGSFGY